MDWACWVCNCQACCAPSSGYIAEIIRRCPTERVLFGSDAGFERGLVPASLDKIYDACQDEGKLRRILYENAQSLVPVNDAIWQPLSPRLN